MRLKLISRIQIQKLNEVALGWIVFSVDPNSLDRVVLFSLFPPLASLKEKSFALPMMPKAKNNMELTIKNGTILLLMNCHISFFILWSSFFLYTILELVHLFLS